MYFPISEWLPSFVLTIAVEAPVVWWLVRKVERDLLRLAVLFLFVNLATHLAAWYVGTQLLDVFSWSYLTAAEAWAIGAEALFYAAALSGIGARRAIAVSAAANLGSFLVGNVFLTLLATSVG